jgi:hypothetical protein
LSSSSDAFWLLYWPVVALVTGALVWVLTARARQERTVALRPERAVEVARRLAVLLDEHPTQRREAVHGRGELAVHRIDGSWDGFGVELRVHVLRPESATMTVRRCRLVPDGVLLRRAAVDQCGQDCTPAEPVTLQTRHRWYDFVVEPIEAVGKLPPDLVESLVSGELGARLVRASDAEASFEVHDNRDLVADVLRVLRLCRRLAPDPFDGPSDAPTYRTR